MLRTAGIVINRQRPATASGILFMTLEDETGYMNLIVFPKEQDRHRNLVLNSRLLLVTGRLERQGQVTHVLVTRLADLSDRLAAIPTASRDFH